MKAARKCLRSRCLNAVERVAVPLGLHLEHGPAVLVEEGDALDQPGKAVGELLCRRRRQNQR